MIEVEPERFEEMVREALDGLPAELGELLSNVAVTVDLHGGRPGLLGLYQGIPLTERSATYGNALPDRVIIFQGPHEREAEDEDDLIVAIGETLIHEIGHYFGLSEEEIEEIEERYWRGDGGDAAGDDD